jgi:L-methionine (R)-S-oxide reductase
MSAPEVVASVQMDKDALYGSLLDDLKQGSMLQQSTRVGSVLANTAAYLDSWLKKNFNYECMWTGFYLVDTVEWVDGEKKGETEEVLCVGPFIGEPAVAVIRHGRGVCGACWAENASQVVPDVYALENYISCDPRAKSELCVPLVHPHTGAVVAILDIDRCVYVCVCVCVWHHIHTCVCVCVCIHSEKKGEFSMKDDKWLTEAMALVAQSIDWTHQGPEQAATFKAPVPSETCSLH